MENKMENINEQPAKPLRQTLSIPEAGRVLGIGRSAAYAAALRGEIPVINIGKLKRVPAVRLSRLLSGE